MIRTITESSFTATARASNGRALLMEVWRCTRGPSICPISCGKQMTEDSRRMRKARRAHPPLFDRVRTARNCAPLRTLLQSKRRPAPRGEGPRHHQAELGSGCERRPSPALGHPLEPRLSEIFVALVAADDAADGRRSGAEQQRDEA